MPTNPAANSRSGATQFMNFAKTLCRLTNIAAPTIRARFSDRPALLLVLTAAEGVCALLPAAIQEQYTMDQADAPTFDPPDDVTIPGQKP